MALETMDYLTIGLSSAVIGSAMGAIVSGIFTWRKDQREMKRERFVSTLIAVETLENYTRSCVQMIHIDSDAQEEAVGRNSYDPLDRVKFPAFCYPDSIGWKWMKPGIAARLREFTAACAANRVDIRKGADYEDAFGTCDSITIACANLGLAAWALAEAIRKKTRLPPAEFHENERDMLDFLREKIKKRAARQAAWEKKWQARQKECTQEKASRC